MNYDKNEFDDKLRKIYDESNYSKKIFENTYKELGKHKSKRGNKFTLYLKLTACFIVLAVIGTLGIATLTKKNLVSYDPTSNNIANNNDNNTNNNEDENSMYDNIISGKANILLADPSSAPIVQLPNGLSYVDFSVLEESDYIAMLKLDKILYGMNYIPKTNKYVYPVTVSKFTVEKNYKGNLQGQIKLATDTETLLPIEDYAKGIFREQAIKFGYDKMTEEERKNTYVKVPTLKNYTKLKENTYYIAYMKYNEDAEMYAIFGYCFFEYNKDTNQIRIPGTNNWEEFELKEYNSNDFNR